MLFIRKYYKAILFAIPIISVLLHFYVFRLDLVGIHVWRQTETQQVIDNFYKEDFNILHPRVNNYSYPDRKLLLEFPIMQWVFAVFYKIFGARIVISRILSFIIGLFSVYGMFYFAEKVFEDKAKAVITAWCFCFSPVFYYYTLNPLPDNFSLCAAIWAVGFFYSYIRSAKDKFIFLSAIFMSLAIMAKLPFILYAVLMATYFVILLRKRETSFKKAISVGAVYILFAIPALVWYASVMYTWKGMVVLKGITDIKQSNAELLEIVKGVLFSELPELLINYGSVLFFIAGFYFMFSLKKYKQRYFPVLLVWGLAVLAYFIFEINTINLVHDYYMFPFLPPIFLLVGSGAAQLLLTNSRILRVITITCLLILPFTAFIRAYSRWDIETDTGFDPVFYKYKDEIRKITPVGANCVVGPDYSDMILLYYIDRKGWSFYDGRLDSNSLKAYIGQGAEYLYVTDSEESKPGIKQHLAEKIFDKGSLRVYKIKQ